VPIIDKALAKDFENARYQTGAEFAAGIRAARAAAGATAKASA
jgi:hypothetical protein